MIVTAATIMNNTVEHFCKPGLIDRTEQLDIGDEICAKSNIAKNIPITSELKHGLFN